MIERRGNSFNIRNMTENDFRFKHSELIEYYQLIEMRLKAICVAILADEGKNWFESLNDYETDSFGTLIKKITELQEQKHVYPLSKEDLLQLDDIRKTRNYWAHQCFGGQQPITFKNDELKRQEFASKIIADLNEAIKWDEKLTKKMNK